jgi:predicted glycosyltransferase
VRIWLDMSAPAHPLIFGPIADRMRGRGHIVEVTARDHAETLELLALRGIEHRRIGKHGGARRSGKLAALLARTRSMVAFGRGRRFDLALAHGSNELALAAAALAIPAVTMTDYEFAVQQHHIGFRLAWRAVTPDAIPTERIARFGVAADRILQFPGLKEEYYLHGFEPNPNVMDALGLRDDRLIATVRPPADLSLYHRKANPLLLQVLLHLGRREDVQLVVLPRTERQRLMIAALDLPSVLMPAVTVDAHSLIAFSDLVVAGVGTMNREAVALGTPAYTTFSGRIGGVDEMLIREGSLRPLTNPRALSLERRGEALERRPSRDPSQLAHLIAKAAPADTA